MKVFENARQDDAARWLACLPTRCEPSATQTAKAYLGGTVGATLKSAKLLLGQRFRR